MWCHRWFLFSKTKRKWKLKRSGKDGGKYGADIVAEVNEGMVIRGKEASVQPSIQSFIYSIIHLFNHSFIHSMNSNLLRRTSIVGIMDPALFVDPMLREKCDEVETWVSFDFDRLIIWVTIFWRYINNDACENRPSSVIGGIRGMFEWRTVRLNDCRCLWIHPCTCDHIHGGVNLRWLIYWVIYFAYKSIEAFTKQNEATRTTTCWRQTLCCSNN